MRPERRGPVAGVVLAAGSSRRMGENKVLLRIEGESLLRRVARRAASAGLAPVVVVVGHEADRAEAELAGLHCLVVNNTDHTRGMSESLRRGIAVVPRDAIAAVIVLADMPLVTSAMIAELVARYRAGAAPLVVSDYAGVLAPPMVYDRSLFGELSAGDGEVCGRRVVGLHLWEAARVSWPAGALRDIDERGDYEALARWVAQRKK